VRIVVSSDWHGDWVSHGVRRIDEIAEAVQASVEDAITKKADLYVFAGDLCDPDSGSLAFEAVALATRAAGQLRRAKIPSVWIAGNHDVIDDGRMRTTLAPLVDAWTEEEDVLAFEEADYRVLELDSKNVALVALPYPHLGKDEQTPHWWESCGDWLADTHAECPLHALIVVSHLAVPGVEPGEEANELQRGRDVAYPVDAIETLTKRLGVPAVLIQGHYHRAQTATLKGLEIHIPGSLARLTFNEEGHAPGYLILEV
jgi:DNA repair exonuclease SbcCD nuclease subunit